MSVRNDLLVDSYMSVFGVTKDDIDKDPVHGKNMDSALIDVYSHQGLHSGEKDEDRKARFKLRGPVAGEYADLATHLRSSDKSLKGMTAMEAVFTAFRRMKTGEADDASSVSDIKINQLTQSDEREKEINKMENGKNAATEVAALAAIANTVSQAGFTPGTAMPEPTANSEAVNAVMKSQKEQRANFSKATKIKCVIYATPEREKMIPGDIKEAKGRIASVEKAYENFVNNTGMKKDENGAITFSKLVPLQGGDMGEVTKNAMAIVEIFQKALADPAYQLPIYLNSKTTRTIKGLEVNIPEQGVKILKPEDCIDMMLDKSAGVIGFEADSAIQVQVKTVTRRADSSAKGTAKDKAKIKSVSQLQYANKGRLDEVKGATKEAKVITKDIEESSRGWKADLPIVKYEGKTASKRTGLPIARTYRIPLAIEAFKLEFASNDIKEALGLTEGGPGNTVQPIDLNDIKALDDLLFGSVSKVIATAVANNVEVGSVTSAVRDQEASVHGAQNAAMAGPAGDLV